IERRGLARILTREPTASLAYKILDPSVLSKPVFDAVHASVVMSGTLHPMEMMRDVLGLAPERTTLREYQSPFPRENRPVLVDSSVTTGYKERTPQMFREIGERLASIALATPGNVAAFFPSYAIMEQVRPAVEVGLRGRKDLIVEEKGLDKSEKEGLVHQMRGEVQNALLLGVQGGSLSEGYDYEGNLLKGVVIVGLPFAAPSLEVESLIGFYDKKFGAGKGRPYAYVHPTFHRVLQAAGRCIRSSEDKGVIVLLDKRFGWGSYRASYPHDFLPRESRDVVGDVRSFWVRTNR
ncbi:MAG: ATP-dependent DNA helicase, partial [Candidatus Thermoplasmatota archaeon]